MRFLIFNLVVGAALFYLLSDGNGPASRPAEAARSAVSAAVDIARTATGPVPAPVAKTPDAAPPRVRDGASEASPAAAVSEPVAKAPESRATGSRAAEANAPEAKPAAEPPPPAARVEVEARPDIAAKTPSADKARETAPAPAAEPRVVATRPVHAAPSPTRNLAAGKPAPIARPVTSDPEVLERRAEVLTVPAPKSAVPKPAANPGRFAIKEGTTLMSRDERLRELSRLADDMEVVYFNSLGN